MIVCGFHANYIFEHILVGTLLLKNLHEARRMVKKCKKVCKDFEQQADSGTVKEWKAMKCGWEGDSSKPDPYKQAQKRGSC
jgi:hypothetical protein